MTTSSLVLVLALVAGGLAAPWGTDVPRCSIECPVTGSPKLAYEPGKTYTYAYSGKSQVQLKGVQDGDSEIEWAAGVDLTWISPCDVAISFRNMKMDGAPGPDAARALERYPMVVAVADGRVQHVCAHPEDQPWAINLKKGVASALQNSIPALSPVASGITVTETDVVGKCPTKYEVETEGEKVIVTKEKNHRHCHERFPTATEIPALWMKAPLPIEESRSECKQEITNGIYTAITCEDKNIVRPAFGLYKYVEANQESTLRFISESSETSAISAITRGELEIESLLYNHETTKDAELAPEVDELMKEICEKTENTVEADAAALVAKAIHLLRRVPASVVERVAEKVRGGHYCGESARLESIFLDAIAFLHEPSAVKVMVEEIEKGRATGGRLALYTAALYLTPRPNTEAVEALTPLFESARPVPSVMLAAASMLNKYCRLAPHCHEEAPVERIAEALATKVERHCSPSAGVEAEEEALAALKALGNMGVVTPAVARAAVSCIEKHEAPTTIRVAAANAFRQAKCHRPAIEKLVEIAVHPAFETEVRIASYLSAIKCAEMEDLETIIEKITEEKNTQVRGFILGHLINIQESTCPTMEHLRYLLTNFVIPADFEKDFRKFSRNVQMGYHAPAFGMGAGVESNIIYAPGSFLPRAVTMNLRADLEDTPMDIGEIGARLEGIDSIIEELFGPEGYLRKATFGKILEDITGFAEEKGYKIMEHMKNTLRTRRSIDASAIADFFGKLYGDSRSEVRAEVFARIMGQEVSYMNIAEALKGITADKIIETFFSLVEDSLEELKGLDLNTARTAHIHMDYALPTIQGLPLKLNFEGTAVAGIKMEGNFNIAEILSNPENMQTGVKLHPGLSIHATGFVGFDTYIAKAGLEMENTISSAAGAAIKVRTAENKKIELELELPEKMELINIKAETYLVKAVGKNVRKIAPSSMRDPRIATESCIDALEPVFGLKVCYNVNIPNIFRANALPLGEPAIAKLYIEKADPSMKGYLMSGIIKNKYGNKMIKVNVEAVGASTPREAEMTLAYTKEEDSHIVSAKIDASNIAAGIWATLTNAEGYKAVETFIKFRSAEFDIARGVKAEVSAKAEGAEEEFAMNVFSGRSRSFNSESHIVEAKFIKNDSDPDMHVEVICRTKNALAELIELNIEVGADLKEIPVALYAIEYTPRIRIPLPVNIHKMEILAKVGAWKVNSFVRKTREAGPVREHTSSIALTKGSKDIFTFEATHEIEGMLPEGITIKNEAAVAIGRSTYRAMYDVIYEAAKMGATVEIIRANDNKKIAEVEAIHKISGAEHVTRFLVEIPEYIRPVKVEAKLAKEGSDRFLVEAAIKHGERVLLEATGPIVARFTSKVAKLQADIKLAALTTEPYLVGANLVFGNKKQVIALEIKEREEPVFGVEWKMARESSEKTTLGVVFVLPALIENKIDAVITQELVHVSFNNLVLPKKSFERRIKGFVDVNIADKKTNVELAWDADKEPQKKLAVDATLISSPANIGHAEIHGNIFFIGEQYHMKLVLKAAGLLRREGGENGFELFLTTPAQKTIALEATSRVQLEEAIAKVITDIKYKNTEEEEYKFMNVIAVEKIGGPYNYAAEAKVIYAAPGHEEFKFEAAAKHQMTAGERLIAFKVDAEAPILKKPVAIDFTVRNAEGSFAGICKMERDAPATILEWALKMNPEEGIEAVEAALDMKAIVELMKIVRAVATFEEEGLRSYGIRTPHPSTYRLNFSKATPSSYTMMVKTPSRTMEGEAKLSPRESAIKVHPNKGRSEAKYEIGYKMNHEGRWGERATKLEVKMNHPVLPRPFMITAKYTAAEETTKGTIELDIFPEEENKITGTIETTRIAENAIRAEVFLNGRLLKVNPKACITVAYAPETLGFKMDLHKTPSEAPIFVVSAKYDETAARTAAVAFTVKMEGRPVFEIAGATEPEEEATCNGLRMKAIMYAAAFGKYDVISKMCKPAFVEVALRRHGAEEEYIAKVGLRYPDTAQVGLYLGSAATGERRPVAVAAVELASPTMIKVVATHEPQEAEMIANEATEVFETVAMSIKSVAMEALRFLEEEAAEKGVRFPSAHFVALMEEAKGEMEAIFRDILAEVRILDMELINEILESPVVSFVSRVYFGVWSQMAEVQHHLSVGIMRAFERYEEKLEDVTEMIMEIAMATMRMVETGKLPEAVCDMIEEIKETEVFRIVKREVDAVLMEYPEEFETIKYVVEKVAEALARDVDVLRERIMEIPAVERTINWAIRHFTSEGALAEKVEMIASALVEELLFVSVEKEGNGVAIRIPLHRPLYSLTQVAQEAVPYPTAMLENLLWAYTEYIPIPVEDLLWAYYNFVPRTITELTALLPPYPRVAMVVGGTEILTFDGLVVRAPRSPCKVLLGAYGPIRLFMSHPQAEAQPELEIKAPSANIIIKPDLELLINGRPLRSATETIGKMWIENNAKFIKIAGPLLKMIVEKEGHVVAVEASGWTFGRVAGLLGPNNGEMGDGLLTPTGEVASNFRELVAAWQEDKQCSTPEAPRAETTVARVIECGAFFGIRSRCNPVVRPEPFVEMCHAARDACGACDAAKAYRTICALKGVEEIFPVAC